MRPEEARRRGSRNPGSTLSHIVVHVCIRSACKRKCFIARMYVVVRTPFPSPSIFAPFKGLYSSLFPVAQQHYLSVAVAARTHRHTRALKSLFFPHSFILSSAANFLPSPQSLRRPSAVPSSPLLSPFFLMQTNFTVEMNCSENEDRTASPGAVGATAAAVEELRHILAFRVPPSHAFRFET